MTQRIGRMAVLREGREKDYEAAHRDVWPEIQAVIKESGVANYSIFRRGQYLFAYFEMPDGMGLADFYKLWGENHRCRDWEEIILPMLIPFRESVGVETYWVATPEIWHLD